MLQKKFQLRLTTILIYTVAFIIYRNHLKGKQTLEKCGI